MSRRIVLRAYEHLVELVADDDVLEMARPRLPDAFRPGRGEVERSWRVHEGEHGWWATASGEHLGARPNADFALDLALADMELWVAEHARRFVFIHAGCVAYDGRAIILPGVSRTGKTTIVAALGRAGAAYYSDEFARIDRRGLVWPYPRPLSFRRGAIGVERRHPGELEFTLASGPARVRLIAFLRFEEAAGLDVSPVTRARTILALLQNTVPAQSRAIESLNAAERASQDARALMGTRGEADETATLLLDVLRSS